MATALAQAVADLLDDLVDGSGNPLLASPYLTRCAERALPFIASDLGIAYVLDESGETTPTLDPLHAELWVMRAEIIACDRLWRTSAGKFSFSSGDKKADHTKESTNWKDLQAQLKAEYKARVAKINPSSSDSILSFDVRPVLFERGRCYCPDHEEDCPT